LFEQGLIFAKEWLLNPARELILQKKDREKFAVLTKNVLWNA